VTRTDKSTIQPVAEFQALPLEMIVATPLLAALRAQEIATQKLLETLRSYGQEKLDFTATEDGKEVHVKVPVLALVPLAKLRIDSLAIHFRYEVTQTVHDQAETALGADAGVQTGPAIAAFMQATLKGSIAHKSATESTTNRSGVLDMSVTASEAPIPEGLARIISLMAHAIPEPYKKLPDKK
jgi:hypothetical protein